VELIEFGCPNFGGRRVEVHRGIGRSANSVRLDLSNLQEEETGSILECRASIEPKTASNMPVWRGKIY